MTLSAATVTFGPEGPTLTAAAPLPVEALVLGRPVAEAAELLPRLFNLCRMAQGLAAKLSLGLPATEDTGTEIIRDHILKLCITLPHAFGLSPLPLPDFAKEAPQQPPRAPLPLPGGGLGRGSPAFLLGPNGLPSDPDAIAGPLTPPLPARRQNLPPHHRHLRQPARTSRSPRRRRLRELRRRAPVAPPAPPSDRTDPWPRPALAACGPDGRP